MSSMGFTSLDQPGTCSKYKMRIAHVTTSPVKG